MGVGIVQGLNFFGCHTLFLFSLTHLSYPPNIMIEQILSSSKRYLHCFGISICLRLEADSAHESFAEFKEFFNDFASTSDHIAVEVVETPGTLRMVLVKDGKDTGVIFRCIPGGHEIHLSPPRSVQR